MIAAYYHKLGIKPDASVRDVIRAIRADSQPYLFLRKHRKERHGVIRRLLWIHRLTRKAKGIETCPDKPMPI